MSSEVHKYDKAILNKNKDLFYAEVINFPYDKKANYLKNEQFTNNDCVWKISDISNKDQFKAVTGICFMFGSLFIMGLYSSLM